MSESAPVYPRRDLMRPGWAHNYSHPSNVAPTYSDSVRSLLYNSLRPAFIIAHGLAALVALILAALHWRSLALEDGKVKLFTTVSAALFTVVCVAEVVGFLAGVFAHVGMVKLFSRSSVVVLIMALVAQILALVNIYANRHPMISQCIAYESRYTGDIEQSGDEATQEPTASDICSDMWHTAAVWNILWLVLIVLVGGIFYVLTLRYLQKMQDPGAGRRPTQPYTVNDHHDLEAPNTYPMSTVSHSVFPRDELDANEDAFDDDKVDFHMGHWDYPAMDHDVEDDEFVNSMPEYAQKPTIITKPAPIAR